MVNQTAAQANNCCSPQFNVVTACRNRNDSANDGVAQALHSMLLQQTCLLDKQILIKRVGDLVHKHHGQPRTCRCNDGIHDDVVGCIPLVNHDNLSCCSSIHKQTADQYDKSATHKHRDVLCVEASGQRSSVGFEDELDLIVTQLLKLRVILSELLLILVSDLLFALLSKVFLLFLLINLF